MFSSCKIQIYAWSVSANQNAGSDSELQSIRARSSAPYSKTWYQRVGQDALQLELEKPGTLPITFFNQYRRSLIYENPLSDAEIISKTKNLKSTELLNIYENQFNRILSENKNEIEFLKNVQAAADQENKPDITLGPVFWIHRTLQGIF